MSTLIAFPVTSEWRYTLSTGYIYSPRQVAVQCADGVTGAGGRHGPFSLEMTRDEEGQTPGGFPGPKPLPGPEVHPRQTGEPTTGSRPGRQSDVWTSLVPFRIRCVLFSSSPNALSGFHHLLDASFLDENRLWKPFLPRGEASLGCFQVGLPSYEPQSQFIHLWAQQACPRRLPRALLQGKGRRPGGAQRATSREAEADAPSGVCAGCGRGVGAGGGRGQALWGVGTGADAGAREARRWQSSLVQQGPLPEGVIPGLGAQPPSCDDAGH